MAELRTFLFTDIVGSVDLKREMPGHSDTERDQAFIELVLTPHRRADRAGAGGARRAGGFDGRRRPFSGVFRHDFGRPLGDRHSAVASR